MKLAIQIDGHPASSGAAGSAYQFIKAALANGHRILIVFFYYDGVFAGLPAGSAFGIPIDWSRLVREYGLDLVVCSAAAERRGLLGSAEDSGNPRATRLAEGFRAGGLSQWVDACIRCDRCVRFAA